MRKMNSIKRSISINKIIANTFQGRRECELICGLLFDKTQKGMYNEKLSIWYKVTLALNNPLQRFRSKWKFEVPDEMIPWTGNEDIKITLISKGIL